MAVTNYYVATGNDDWDVDQDGIYTYNGTTIRAAVSNAVTPPTSYDAYANDDTSGIGSGTTITAATVSFDESTYTATKGVAKSYSFSMWDGANWQVLATYTFTTATTRTVTLNSTQIGWINKTGYTQFNWDVTDPGGTNFRAFTLKAYETSQAVACRMTITTPSGIRLLATTGVGV